MKARYLKLAAAIVLLVYTLLLLYWMFAGFGRTHAANGAYRYNLMPFATINRYLFHEYYFRTRVINIIGNIGVFVPYGIVLPLLFRWRFPVFLFIILVGLLALELMQMLTRRGSFDVDDIILNTVGAVIGWGFNRLIMGRLDRRSGVYKY